MEEGCGGGSADGNTRCVLAPALGKKDLEGECWHLHSSTGDEPDLNVRKTRKWRRGTDLSGWAPGDLGVSDKMVWLPCFGSKAEESSQDTT